MGSRATKLIVFPLARLEFCHCLNFIKNFGILTIVSMTLLGWSSIRLILWLPLKISIYQSLFSKIVSKTSNWEKINNGSNLKPKESWSTKHEQRIPQFQYGSKSNHLWMNFEVRWHYCMRCLCFVLQYFDFLCFFIG